MATITLSTQQSMPAAISTSTLAPLYCCFHPDNPQVFEDFSGDERFEIINGFDDASPTQLNTIEQILQFMSELEKNKDIYGHLGFSKANVSSFCCFLLNKCACRFSPFTAGS